MKRPKKINLDRKNKRFNGQEFSIVFKEIRPSFQDLINLGLAVPVETDPIEQKPVEFTFDNIILPFNKR